MASGIIPVLPQSAEQLDLLLLQPCRRHKVHQEGIHFFGTYYMHVLLGDAVGDSVIIRYDPMNLANIRVYVVDALEEERFLCLAESVERGGQEVSLQEIVTARRSRRKRVGEEVRERKRAVARYASARSLARLASSRLVSAEAPSQSISDADKGVSPKIAPASDGAPVSKVRWYDVDASELVIPATALSSTSDANGTSTPSLLSEPEDSFLSTVRWYDDE